MAEKPILFSAPMVRAILAGRKTQTRRVVKLRHPWNVEERDDGRPWPWHPDYVTGGEWDGWVRCPYGKPGDRLWVRETHSIEHQVEHDQDPPHKDGRPVRRCEETGWYQAHYRATDTPPDLTCENERCRACRDGDFGPHWRPSIHMPRWACRLVLEITDVRIERLQDISEEDAIAEGCRWVGTSGGRDYYSAVSHPPDVRVETFNPSGAPSAPEAFKALWNSINGAGSREANPWVWVVSFKRVAAASSFDAEGVKHG